MTNNNNLQDLTPRLTEVRAAATAFYGTIGSLGNTTSQSICDGLITVLYSIMKVVYKNDGKGFRAQSDAIAKTLKRRYREETKVVVPTLH